MSNTQNLRDRYFSNDIFKIGDLVEDISTGEKMKILDRGANYVTVATNLGITKKWLNQLSEDTTPTTVATTVDEKSVDSTDTDFVIESGQIKAFGFCTKNFNLELSQFIVEQFAEFDDLYSKHQIIKCLDIALTETNLDKAYSLLEKVDKFYSTHNMLSPIIVEVMKNETERTRIAEILATIANVPVSKSNNLTVNNSIKALKEKYQTRKQWEVLMPFLKMARDSGLVNATQNLPYSANSLIPSMAQESEEIIFDVMQENIDLVLSDLEYQDIVETFDENEFSDNLISEVLSNEEKDVLRLKANHSDSLSDAKLQRAMSRGASTTVVMQRARRLAEVMFKRRMYNKNIADLSKEEKDRYENNASGHKAAIAKLAHGLVSKVRMLQSPRQQHTNDVDEAKKDTNVGAA